MTGGQPRTQEQRKVDTLAKLAAPAADVWVATAAADAGRHASSYLVPLSPGLGALPPAAGHHPLAAPQCPLRVSRTQTPRT